MRPIHFGEPARLDRSDHQGQREKGAFRRAHWGIVAAQTLKPSDQVAGGALRSIVVLR
jgi:hypothetical protein